jgi:hypothetical protein
MRLPRVDHPTDRPNFYRIFTDDGVFWFSYQTCVAFNLYDGDGLAVRVNDWSTTTGKHLNWIDDGDKANRIPGDEFERLLQEA